MFDCQLKLFPDFDDEEMNEWVEEGMTELESYLAKHAAFADFIEGRN